MRNGILLLTRSAGAIQVASERDYRSFDCNPRVTGSYLLALAVSKDGKLATFDKKLATEVVSDGREAISVVR